MRFTECKCACHIYPSSSTSTSVTTPSPLDGCTRCVGYHEGVPY